MHATALNVQLVYAVVGRDPFLRREMLDRILGALAGEMDTLGPARFDGSQARPAEVLDEVRTMSLLGSRRVVVVDTADPFITANRSALERYCSAPAETGSLILLCDTMPKNTRLHRIISDKGSVIRCEAPRGRGIVSWIMNRARSSYGKQVNSSAAAKLVDHVGDALGSLDAELAKLAAYVGERSEVTLADIDALTGHHREEKVFAVTDAMAALDPVAALRNWEQVLATDRAAPGRAIAGLAWGVRQLLEARRDFSDGVSIGVLGQRMRTDPGLLRRRLERVTVEQLEQQQRDLLGADLAVKTGGSTVDLAVEKFIVKHCAS